MSSAQQKTLEDFIELKNRNALAHAIRATIDLGVVAVLRNGQRTAEQLATELNVFPDALKRLLNVVAETELIEKYGEDYALAPITRLIPELYLDFGDSYWKHLTLHVKTGAPLPICDEIEITDFDHSLNKASEEWMPFSRPGARPWQIAPGTPHPRSRLWFSRVWSNLDSL